MPASELTATLNEADGSEPGDVLCTLEHPSSYGSSGVQTYGAPATDANPCPQLTAGTTYFFVLERAKYRGQCASPSYWTGHEPFRRGRRPPLQEWSIIGTSVTIYPQCRYVGLR